MRKITSNTILRPLGVNSKMFRKRTINFRKNWQHGFSTTSYIRPGNTAVLVIPSACTTSPSDISRFSFPTPVMKYVTQCITLYRTFISVQSPGCVGSAFYQPLLESYNLPPQEIHPKWRQRRPLGWRRSRSGGSRILCLGGLMGRVFLFGGANGD